MWCVRWGCGCQPWFHATSTERRNILTAFMDVRAVITLRDVVTRSSSPVWTGREVKGRTGAGSWRQTRNHPGILMQVAGNFCRLSSVCSCICHCTGLINCHTDVTLGLTHSVIAHHWGESMHALVRWTSPRPGSVFKVQYIMMRQTVSSLILYFNKMFHNRGVSWWTSVSTGRPVMGSQDNVELVFSHSYYDNLFHRNAMLMLHCTWNYTLSINSEKNNKSCSYILPVHKAMPVLQVFLSPGNVINVMECSCEIRPISSALYEGAYQVKVCFTVLCPNCTMNVILKWSGDDSKRS